MSNLFWLYAVVIFFNFKGTRTTTVQNFDAKGIYQYKVIDTAGTRYDTLTFFCPTYNISQTTLYMSFWRTGETMDSVKVYVNGTIYNTYALGSTESQKIITFKSRTSTPENVIMLRLHVANGGSVAQRFYIRPKYIVQ